MKTVLLSLSASVCQSLCLYRYLIFVFKTSLALTAKYLTRFSVRVLQLVMLKRCVRRVKPGIRKHVVAYQLLINAKNKFVKLVTTGSQHFVRVCSHAII